MRQLMDELLDLEDDGTLERGRISEIRYSFRRLVHSIADLQVK